jgi:hypothetical protein
VCIFQLISKIIKNEKESVIDTSLNSIKIETPVPSEEVVDLSENLNDDRNFISIDDKTILIIEDDASFVYKWPAIMVLRQLLLIKEKQGISMQKIQAESDYFRYEITGN